MEKIIACVVTYNRLELLKQVIDGLRNQTRKIDEIVVINNGSTDGTGEWLQDQNDITTINQDNLGRLWRTIYCFKIRLFKRG